jgi:hypothetical protein
MQRADIFSAQMSADDLWKLTELREVEPKAAAEIYKSYKVICT